MEAKHTATPPLNVKMMKVYGQGVGNYVFIVKGGYTIAHVFAGPVYANDDALREIAQRNAEFIVRACNSFDDLVMALQGVLRVADRKTDEFDAARAALAKAGA
jgi:hypothetical protein